MGTKVVGASLVGFVGLVGLVRLVEREPRGHAQTHEVVDLWTHGLVDPWTRVDLQKEPR